MADAIFHVVHAPPPPTQDQPFGSSLLSAKGHAPTSRMTIVVPFTAITDKQPEQYYNVVPDSVPNLQELRVIR